MLTDGRTDRHEEAKGRSFVILRTIVKNEKKPPAHFQVPGRIQIHVSRG